MDTNESQLTRRELGIQKILINFPSIEDSDKISFHCDSCNIVLKCDYAFDVYNAYGGGVVDTGCIRGEKR